MLSEALIEHLCISPIDTVWIIGDLSVEVPRELQRQRKKPELQQHLYLLVLLGWISVASLQQLAVREVSPGWPE